MSRIPNLRRVFRLHSGRTAVDNDTEEEIRFHLETRIEELKKEGMATQEAERTARAEFGDVYKVREELRKLGRRRETRRRRGELLSSIVTDVRIAIRGLRKQLGFSLVVVMTLATAIGASTIIFSAVDALLLRSLPFPEPDELVHLTLVIPPSGERAEEERSWSYLKFQAFMEAQGVLESGVIYRSEERNLTQVRHPEMIKVEAVSSDYFSVLGVRASHGRFFLPEEDQVPGRDFVAVLSHEFWERGYRRDRDIVGKILHVDHQPYTIVGIAAPGFRGISSGVDIWVPTMTERGGLLGASIHTFHAFGRLAETATLEQARFTMPRLAEVVTQVDPRAVPMDIRIQPLSHLRIGPRLRQALVVLFMAVVFVHLIACVNLANLLMARTAGRSREVAIRAALGAKRGRLLRQLLTENAVLALVGAGAGLPLAFWGTGLLQQIGLQTENHMAQTQVGLTNVGFQQVNLDLRTLTFALCLTLVTALIFGLLPAMRASRSNLNTILKAKDGWKGKGNRTDRVSPGMPQFLVAAQVALALVLLIGSGLLLQSFTHLLRSDVGYSREHVLSARVQLPRDKYGDHSSYGSERSARFLKDLVERVHLNPGVETAGLARCTPLAGSCPGSNVYLPDSPSAEPGAEPTMRINMVEGDYFGALAIRLERGRLFRSTDDGESNPVAMVNQTAAEWLWQRENPIGRRLSVGRWFGPNTVVGVVADVHYGSPESPPEPMVYVPLAQLSAMGGTVVIRGRDDPYALVEGLKAHLRALDPDLPLADVKTMSERAMRAAFTSWFSALLLGLFAVAALLLSTMGVYGVLSVIVSRQAREVGVRMALGARGQDVLSLVLRQAAAMVIPGLVAGLLLALLLTRVLEAILFEIAPLDPAAFLGGTVVLGLTGALAGLVPTLRAIRVNPAEILRSE